MIKIGSIYCKIDESEDFIKHDIDGAMMAGYYDPVNSTVSTCNKIPLTLGQRRLIFMHEIMHAIRNIYGVPVEPDNEEHFAQCMANAILQVYDDNPGIFEKYKSEGGVDEKKKGKSSGSKRC